MNDPRKEELDNETAAGAAEDTPVEPVDEDAGGPSDDQGDSTEADEPTPEERLRAERDEFESKWLRVVAELDNVRKRNRRELGDTRRFAQADVLRSFLEVLDNFDRALQSTGEAADTEAGDAFREGVDLIHQTFRGVIRDKGAEPIVALDAEFDPNVHEAISQMPRGRS